MLPASRRPRRFPMVIRVDRADPDEHAPIEQRREGRDDLLDRRRGRHRDRQDVVDEQRRGRDERDRLADVPAGDRVRAATGRVGDADLAVADRDHDQQAADQDADLEPVGQGDDAAEDQDAQDLLGRVGRRRDGVRAEDRQRLLLRQPLAELVLARERAPEQERRGPRRRPCRSSSSGRWRPPWRSAGPCRCSGSRALCGRSTRTRRSPGLRPCSGRRPPIIRRRRAAGRRGVRAGPAARIDRPDGIDVVRRPVPRSPSRRPVSRMR